MKNSIIAWIAIVILVVVGVAWWMFAQPAPSTATNTQTEQQQAGTITNTTATNTPQSATVHMTANGFEPKSVSVAKGGTITWVNDTNENMWVATAMHPTHSSYDNTTRAEHCVASYSGKVPFDQCAPGSTYSFTFGEEGAFNYHNHSNASQFGSVTVTAQ